MNPMRKIAVVAGCLGATLTAGALGASMVGVASAQTDSGATAVTASGATASTPAPSSDSTTPAPPNGQQPPKDARGPAGDPSKGGHVANGITETVLTGDEATKATAAAQTAVPGATVVRAETDAEGAAFEVHVTKSDGTPATVKLDANFAVTSVEDGMK